MALADLVTAAVEAVEERARVIRLVPVGRAVERFHLRVARLPAPEVHEPVADHARGEGQERAAGAVVREHRLMEGEHGDPQLVVGALDRRAGEEPRRLRLDERQVVPDQLVRAARIAARIAHAQRYVVASTHGSPPRL